MQARADGADRALHQRGSGRVVEILELTEHDHLPKNLRQRPDRGANGFNGLLRDESINAFGSLDAASSVVASSNARSGIRRFRLRTTCLAMPIR